MEEILKEILYELQEIRKELNKDSTDSIELKVTLGDDVLVEKVIKSINDKSRINFTTGEFVIKA